MNKNIFTTLSQKLKRGLVKNNQGGNAYEFSDKHLLAQLSATGCFNNTFYVEAEQQLESIVQITKNIDPIFIAKAAIYVREKGFMKDMPALLLAILTDKDPELFKKVFPRVIDNGKMLRNYVQIIRSGAVGRKSFGTAPKKVIQKWINSRTEFQLLRDSVGQSPSLSDIIKMVRPKPESSEREALYGYVIGRDVNLNVLPQIVKEYQEYRANGGNTLPNIPFELLTSLSLGKDEWTEIALNASWQTLRMNLNTFKRHGVLTSDSMVEFIAQKLSDRKLIQNARVFPYQLLTAYLNVSNDMPFKIKEALQDALEVATSNIPQYEGNVVVAVDVSGSMQSPVTGYRQGSTTKVRCIDVAALIGASVLRVNKNARVIPFESNVVNMNLNPRDSVMTNAKLLASVGGGGTNCSAPLELLNAQNYNTDTVIYVSDNESWIDSRYYRSNTGLTLQWNIFKKRNPKAKLICIDITPNNTTQVANAKDVLNIGGFSDNVFSIIKEFCKSGSDADYWVKFIENSINLEKEY